MQKLLLSFLIMLLQVGCRKDVLPGNLPQRIEEKIKALQAQPTQNPLASVYQYEYKGQIVYYFPPVCCDQMSELYNRDCKLICHPDGGLTGKGDGKCTDFFGERKNEKLIWKDNREK